MDDSDETRATLLVRVRDAHDSEAWSRFVRIYSPLVYRYARRYGLQDADAGDVTQEVLRKVARSIRRFEYDPEQGSFRGWLMAVTRGKLREFLAHRQRQPQGTGDTAMLKVLENQSAWEEESNVWEREYQKCLFDWAAREIRSEFEDSTWQAFWQTSVEGKAIPQVAEAMGMTVGAVYIARSRVLARLKKQIQQVEEQ